MKKILLISFMFIFLCSLFPVEARIVGIVPYFYHNDGLAYFVMRLFHLDGETLCDSFNAEGTDGERSLMIAQRAFDKVFDKEISLDKKNIKRKIKILRLDYTLFFCEMKSDWQKIFFWELRDDFKEYSDCEVMIVPLGIVIERTRFGCYANELEKIGNKADNTLNFSDIQRAGFLQEELNTCEQSHALFYASLVKIRGTLNDACYPILFNELIISKETAGDVHKILEEIGEKERPLLTRFPTIEEFRNYNSEDESGSSSEEGNGEGAIVMASRRLTHSFSSIPSLTGRKKSKTPPCDKEGGESPSIRKSLSACSGAVPLKTPIVARLNGEMKKEFERRLSRKL